MKDASLMIRISEDDKEALKAIADNNNTTISKLVSEQIKSLIKRAGTSKSVNHTNTFSHVLNTLIEFNREKGYSLIDRPNKSGDMLYGVIEFSPSNFREAYPVGSRTYWFSCDNSYVYSRMGIAGTNAAGGSLLGFSLDGTEKGMRLDAYINDWLISDIYLGYPGTKDDKEALFKEDGTFICYL